MKKFDKNNMFEMIDEITYKYNINYDKLNMCYYYIINNDMWSFSIIGCDGDIYQYIFNYDGDNELLKDTMKEYKIYNRNKKIEKIKKRI